MVYMTILLHKVDTSRQEPSSKGHATNEHSLTSRAPPSPSNLLSPSSPS